MARGDDRTRQRRPLLLLVGRGKQKTIRLSVVAKYPYVGVYTTRQGNHATPPTPRPALLG